MKGIDVSVHQRTISWKAIKAAGMTFAYLKATEGVGFTDSSFARHKTEAKKVGIPTGAYHYARPDTNISARDPILEADSFVDVVRPLKGDLLPALDFEEPGLAPAKMREWATAWLARVHERTGVKPLFYVSQGFWDQHVRGISPFRDYPLWLARWGPNDGQPHAADPIAGWPTVTMHQFTSKGTIAGFGGRVDLNVLPGGVLKAITVGSSLATPAPLRVLAEAPPELCYPHPAGPGVVIGQGLHETGGLPGNWAMDFMAPGGWPVLAPCDGTVSRFSGHDPATGTHPPGDVFGYSLYVKDAQGRTYFFTHLGSRSCEVGQRVESGQKLGRVGNWPHDPGRSHTHLGVTSPLGAAQAKARIIAISTANKLPT